jgi:hypothetical protein
MIKAFEGLTPQMFISFGNVSIDADPIDTGLIRLAEIESTRPTLARWRLVYPLAKETDRGINAGLRWLNQQMTQPNRAESSLLISCSLLLKMIQPTYQFHQLKCHNCTLR